MFCFFICDNDRSVIFNGTSEPTYRYDNSIFRRSFMTPAVFVCDWDVLKTVLILAWAEGFGRATISSKLWPDREFLSKVSLGPMSKRLRLFMGQYTLDVKWIKKRTRNNMLFSHCMGLSWRKTYSYYFRTNLRSILLSVKYDVCSSINSNWLVQC